MLTKSQKFELIKEYLEGDIAFEADCVQVDIARKLHVSEREKSMADLISCLFKIVHPHKKCPHADWESETETCYKLMKKEFKPPLT